MPAALPAEVAVDAIGVEAIRELDRNRAVRRKAIQERLAPPLGFRPETAPQRGAHQERAFLAGFRVCHPHQPEAGSGLALAAVREHDRHDLVTREAEEQRIQQIQGEMEVRGQEHQRPPASDHRQRFQQPLRSAPARDERFQARRDVDPGAGHSRRRQHELLAHVRVAADEREGIPGTAGGVPQRRDEAGQDGDSISPTPESERGGQVGEDADSNRRPLAVSPHQKPPERITKARQQVQAARVAAFQQCLVPQRLQAAPGFGAGMHARVDASRPAVEPVADLDGRGRRESPGADGADAFEYDPTVGVCGGLWSGGVDFGLPGDQRPDEALSLVYLSPPLDEPLTVIGRARAFLHVSSTAPVMGFAVSFSDVAPDGNSHLIAKGMLNGTRRRSLIDPEPLTAGEVVELDIPIDATAWRFAPGHRICVAVASADFPNVWPTPEPGRNEVHRGPTTPSRLVLPVVPLQGSATPPSFAPSPKAATRSSTGIQPPRWEVTRDVLTGRTRVTIDLTKTNRVSSSTVIRQELLMVNEVDPRHPAHANSRGRFLARIERPGQRIEARSDIAIQGTRSAFQVVIDLDVRLNEARHFARRWTESVPRQLL